MGAIMKPSLIILLIVCIFYVIDNLLSVTTGSGIGRMLFQSTGLQAGPDFYRYVRLLFYVGLLGYFMSMFKQQQA